VIYFLQAAGGGPIKIGHTTRAPRLRLMAAQVFSPTDLVLRAECPGDAATEARVHAHLARSHVRGEWFAPTSEVEEFIEGVADGLSIVDLLAPLMMAPSQP
jgi:hypothetical protein